MKKSTILCLLCSSLLFFSVQAQQSATCSSSLDQAVLTIANIPSNQLSASTATVDKITFQSGKTTDVFKYANEAVCIGRNSDGTTYIGATMTTPTGTELLWSWTNYDGGISHGWTDPTTGQVPKESRQTLSRLEDLILQILKENILSSEYTATP